MARRDHYDFSHKLLPVTVFKNSKIMMEQILESNDMFKENLKIMWKSIKFRKNQPRSSMPSFDVVIYHINETNFMAIIYIPEAINELETPYIGIVFDKEYNVRYFTYEIGEYFGERYYALCEWVGGNKHLNYGSNSECNLELFKNGVSKIINIE